MKCLEHLFAFERGDTEEWGREMAHLQLSPTWKERTSLCKGWKTVEMGLKEQCATLLQHMAVKKCKLIKGKPLG